MHDRDVDLAERREHARRHEVAAPGRARDDRGTRTKLGPAGQRRASHSDVAEKNG